MRRFKNEKREAIWYEGTITKITATTYHVTYEGGTTRKYVTAKWTTDFVSKALRIVH
jgi:hypothetical protein